MRSRTWLVLSMLAFPALASAQTVKEADLIGGWRAEVELADSAGTSPAWLVLWPDGLWWYGGALMWHHQGVRGGGWLAADRRTRRG